MAKLTKRIISERLGKHCLALCSQVIWPELRSDGYIPTIDPNNGVHEDEVVTHHFVDLCIALSRDLFVGNIYNACDWFLNKRFSFQNPFAVSTPVISGFIPEDLKNEIYDKSITPYRKPSGLIDIYSGYLGGGGSWFSTLWAVKILGEMQSQQEYNNVINDALIAVRKNWENLHRNSYKAYYLNLLKYTTDKTLKREAKDIIREILAGQDEGGLWDDDILYSAYIINDLIEHIGVAKVRPAVRKCLIKMFDLDSEQMEVPPLLKWDQKKVVESVYLQRVIRAVIAAVNFLKAEQVDVSGHLAVTLIESWPKIYSDRNRLAGRLKEMMEQYGGIDKAFALHNDAAEPLLLGDNSYDKNVFIMMPFRSQENEAYEQIEKIIKKQLKKQGFTAWLATDAELCDGLWDNVCAFMVGCKYGIAVFTRKEIQTERGIKVEPDFNPNVSLELGFFLSRAKDVLILKDKPLKSLPTDLVGKLYKEFNLNTVSRQLPQIIRAWAKKIKDKETQKSDRLN